MTKVFLLDDEPDMTDMTATILRRQGFDIQTENDPVAGLSQLEESDFDIIIIDLMMPRLSGLQVIERLRGGERHKNTPIIALSAKRLNDLERKSMLDWRARFLTKPVTPSRLCQVVEEIQADLEDREKA